MGVGDRTARQPPLLAQKTPARILLNFWGQARSGLPEKHGLSFWLPRALTSGFRKTAILVSKSVFFLQFLKLCIIKVVSDLL